MNFPARQGDKSSLRKVKKGSAVDPVSPAVVTHRQMALGGLQRAALPKQAMGLERDGRLKIVESGKEEGGTKIQRRRPKLQHIVSTEWLRGKEMKPSLKGMWLKVCQEVLFKTS